MSVATELVMPTDEEDASIRLATASDPDAYELSDAELARLQPAREVLPGQIGRKAAEQLLGGRGRHPGQQNKVALHVRYDLDVIQAFKASGDGWQVRMNDALRAWATAQGWLS